MLILKDQLVETVDSDLNQPWESTFHECVPNCNKPVKENYMNFSIYTVAVVVIIWKPHFSNTKKNMYFLKCSNLQILDAEGNFALTQLSVLAIIERKELGLLS